MKTILYKIASYSIGLIFLVSCASTKPNPNEVFIDNVCGMKVNKSESFISRYNGSKYYFDSYNCKEAFVKNPKVFLEKKCVKDDAIIDPICGVKVDLSESYDLKYSGKIYHFHSNDCKQAFKMNPENAMKNKCAPKDSIK